nr:YidC/Oxa1 family membrane protein insertase [Lachnospiraceae bacterium]
PLTYRQQKFSMMTRKMQPELKEIQKKYKGKKDQESMMAQNEETTSLYDKYGISPTGSCLQLVIQMPILFALYRVFNNVPAYINSVKSIFTDLVNDIMATDGFSSKMESVMENASLRGISVDFSVEDKTDLGNYIIDVLYKLGDNGWYEMTKTFPDLTDVINSTKQALDNINYFIVLNISDTPWNQMKSGFTSGHYGVLIVAFLIPVLSYLTQVLNIKMMPQNPTDAGDQMAQQMKMMNTMMPLMSLFITFTVPVGLGLYWVAGALIRFIQQYFLNKHFENIDLDEIIEKNKEKAALKKEKRGERQAQIYNAATMNTRKSLSEKAKINLEDKDALDQAEALRSAAVPGSLASKANLVKEYNEKNSK